MGQKTQSFQNGTDDAAWLASLVGTFETISRSNAPCAPLGADEVDSSDLAALMAHLSRTTQPTGGYVLSC